MQQIRRIGVVMDGGGGKGAYQIGCWKALRERDDLEICAVAGSSVGALNALLMGANRFEDAYKIWTELRPWHVVGIRVRNILLFPVWLIALVLRLGSEPSNNNFGPDDTTFLMLYLAFVGFVFLTCAPRSFETWIWLGPLVAFTVGAEFAWLLRAVILKLGLTTNTPLVKKVETVLKRQAAITIPSYATLSRWEPFSDAKSYWYGWVPEYVRFDLMDHQSILEVVLASASLPGIFPSSMVLGSPAIDGGWCDNSPLAPLLFGGQAEPDIIFILHLEQDPLNPERSGFVFLKGLGGKNPFNFRDGNDLLDRRRIAAKLWEIHREVQNLRIERHRRTFAVLRAPDQMKPAETAVPPSSSHTSPQIIIPVIPSVSLGGFVSGTLAFSARKAKKLIARGEQDMKQVLASLEDKLVSA